VSLDFRVYLLNMACVSSSPVKVRVPETFVAFLFDRMNAHVDPI
jgi:hypothetical protein